MSELDWLFANADRITVGGLLAFALFALYRGWIVLGSTYRDCLVAKTRLESEVEQYILEDKREKEEMRHELALLRQSPPPRKRSP